MAETVIVAGTVQRKFLVFEKSQPVKVVVFQRSVSTE